MELFQRGMIQIDNEDNEVVEDPNVVTTIDGEDGPLNGKIWYMQQKKKKQTKKRTHFF